MADSIDTISDSDETEAETRRLIVAITDFLRDQLIARTDFVPEDRDCLEIAIQCLEMAYNLEGRGYVQYRFSRPLMDIFTQVTNPVSVRDKIRADYHKEEGNSYMRRSMYPNAEAEYTNAIALDQWNAIYYCNRAKAKIELRRYFEAIADCRQALLLNPDYAKAHSRMGQAYALLHRPREAARCFRQALELEPENERYRHNLRIAENEINRPDPAQLITDLLASLFGLGRPTTQSSSSGALPRSFMLITESHPPIPSTSTLTGENPENVDSSQISQITPTAPNNTPTNEDSETFQPIENILFPSPFGVIDEGSDEQPILEFELPSSPDSENSLNPGEEIVINIPLATFEFIPISQNLLSHADNNSGNVKTVEKRPAENLQNNVQKEENAPHGHSETKSSGIENVQVGKTLTPASMGEIPEIAPSTRKEQVKKEKTALDSSNNNFDEQQNKTSNIIKESTVNDYGTSGGGKEERSKLQVSGPNCNYPNGDKEIVIATEKENHQNDDTSEKDKDRRQNLTGQNKESDKGEPSEKDLTEDVD